MSRPPPRKLDANQQRLLEQQGFTAGLVQAVSHFVNAIPLRIWVIDNSAMMQTRDGHSLAGNTFDGLTVSDCTRWEEAQNEVAFHAYMSGCLGVPTRFNMVNSPVSMTGTQLPSCFSIAEHGPASLPQELGTAKQIMGQVRPYGTVNNLAYHIRQIRAMVVQMAPQLVQTGKVVSVLLATCGLPTDHQGQYGPAIVRDLVQALTSLQGLPLQIMFRLCTDDEQVVDFYNKLDAKTNFSFDVVDDFFGEALEVYLKNPWLNYALPLHRFRQLFSIPAFDRLDEQALSFPQLRQFCACLFSTGQPLPDPAMDWVGFIRSLAMLLQIEKKHFNPITKVIGPWIDLRRLHLVYGRNIRLPPDIPIEMPQAQPQQSPYQQTPFYQQQQQQPANNFRQQQNSAGRFQQHSQPFHQQPPPNQQQNSSAPAPAPAPSSGVSATKYEQQATGDEAMTEIKRSIVTWATASPAHQHLRSIEQLLGTVPETFPPAYGIAPHDYFNKWKAFSMDALAGKEEAVLKRAMRKAKFFLHPDKLPKDLSKEQSFLFKMLWDIIADAWEAFEGKQ